MRSLAAAVLLTGLALGCGHRASRSAGSSEGRTAKQAGSAQEPQAPVSPDDVLEQDVRARLYGDPQLTGGGSIVVLVDGGRVLLEGWVSSENERTLAEADAATVSGVTGVDDRLVVRPWLLSHPPAGDD